MMTRAKSRGLDSGTTDDFNFQLIEGFPGYDSATDKTTVKAGTLIRGSKNVYKKLSGTIAARPGLKQRGAVDSTLAGVNSSFEWYTSLGKTLPLRVCNSKLQVESDIVVSGTPVWYDLLTSLTTTRWVFDSWWDNTNKKDVLLMVDGTSNLRNWSGAMAVFVSYAVNIITLDRDAATAGFSASGNVIINGTTYSYSGRSGSTLTGTQDASAVSAGAVVMEYVGTTATTPASGFNNDFLKVIDNHVYVGSYTSRLNYVSKTTSYTDYSQSTPRIPGDGELITMDSNGKGIGVHNGLPVLSAGTSLWYEISYSQITVGSTLSEQTKVSPVRLSGLQAALGHEFIDNVENDLIFVDQSNQLRMFGNFRNLFETKFPSLSLAVQQELHDEDFTGGHLKSVSTDTGAIIYITAPLSGKDYMYETRQNIDMMGNLVAERFWHPPQVRNIARIATISGQIYGHSNSYPQIYQVWATGQWHDDSPSGSAIPYDSICRIAYQQNGRRQGKLSFDKTYFEGYMTQGTKLYGNVYYDYQGATSTANLDLNSTGQAAFFSGASAPSLGDSSFGDNPLGDGLTVESNDQEQLPKFRIIKGVSLVDCYEYALEVYSQDVDSRWEILCLGANPSLSTFQGIEITQ